MVNHSLRLLAGNRLASLATNVAYRTTLTDMLTGYKLFDRGRVA
ncbi:MAG: hypothetical protein ABR511_10210 [Acidimicrobiales bacterium]